MNNKEILKNVLVTVGLLTVSVVALIYFNSKLNETSKQRIVNIAPSATIHPYNPKSLTYQHTSHNRSQGDNISAMGVSEIPNPATAVQAANYPNNLVIHAAPTVSTSLSSNGNNTSSNSSRSTIVQQRQQMNLGALTAVSSRPISSVSVSNSTMLAPFQDASAPPGTISRKDLPDDPEEPFPDEDVPVGSGLIVLSLCALGYVLIQKLTLNRA